jgi:hypothetical protein
LTDFELDGPDEEVRHGKVGDIIMMGGVLSVRSAMPSTLAARGLKAS